MAKVRVASFSVSMDGFGAGPAQSLEQPLGRGGEALHGWVFPTRTFQRMLFGKESGSTGPNMLRPRIQAPTLAKPRAARSSSAPVAPPPPPCMLWKVRVENAHSIRSVPRTPSGLSRLWSGPALKPSIETPMLLTRTLDMGTLLCE